MSRVYTTASTGRHGSSYSMASSSASGRAQASYASSRSARSKESTMAVSLSGDHINSSAIAKKLEPYNIPHMEPDEHTIIISIKNPTDQQTRVIKQITDEYSQPRFRNLL